jgi:hypothetical protein
MMPPALPLPVWTAFQSALCSMRAAAVPLLEPLPGSAGVVCGPPVPPPRRTVTLPTCSADAARAIAGEAAAIITASAAAIDLCRISRSSIALWSIDAMSCG